MTHQIKNRFTGAIIHEGDYNSLLEAIAGAIKAKADLYSADLYSANLSGADLSGADLSRADLSRANLSGADLSRADLYSADLSRADLYSANLSGADLYSANLSGADLYSANLSGADLSGANLSRADNLDSHESHALAIAQTRHLPEGEIIGWKKLKDGLIAKLVIPARAKRCHAFSRKSRASYARVVAIYDGKKQVKEGRSLYDGEFIYKPGKIVRPRHAFDENWQNECASGIHFFITRPEAEAYTY